MGGSEALSNLTALTEISRFKLSLDFYLLKMHIGFRVFFNCAYHPEKDQLMDRI